MLLGNPSKLTHLILRCQFVTLNSLAIKLSFCTLSIFLNYVLLLLSMFIKMKALVIPPFIASYSFKIKILKHKKWNPINKFLDSFQQKKLSTIPSTLGAHLERSSEITRVFRFCFQICKFEIEPQHKSSQFFKCICVFPKFNLWIKFWYKYIVNSNGLIKNTLIVQSSRKVYMSYSQTQLQTPNSQQMPVFPETSMVQSYAY